MSRYFILPNQKLPESKKTEEWDVQHVYNFLAYNGVNIDDGRKQDQLKCWKYYLNIHDKGKEDANRAVTKPYGYSLGLEYMQYPLVESKIEQVVGEYLTRPVKKKTYVINKNAKSKKMNDMHSMVAEDLLREFNQEFESELGFTPTTENAEQQLPEDIEAFLENDYKSESEEVSDIILEQVLEVKNNKNRIKDLLVDLLVADEAIAFVDQEDAHPAIQREDIFETFMDWDPEKEIQKDPQYIVRNKFLAYNDIINSYDLTEEEECVVRSYADIMNGRTNVITSTYGTGYDDRNFSNTWFRNIDTVMRVRCVEMIWISKRQIRVKVSINQRTGKEIYKILPESYRKKGSDIKSIWVDYKRRVLMCGPNLVLDRGPVEERYGRIDNIKKDTIPAIGIRRNNFLGARIRSFAMKLLQLQDFASEILFEIRLCARRSPGRVLVYDAAQIPKQFLKTGGYHNAMNRVMHHAKKDQFLIINSQDKASRYAFNQFTSLDMSNKGAMQELFNTLALIEDLASKFVGLSPEREGQIDQYQTAQGAERAVAQSTARTEIYTGPFDNFLEAILEKILMKAKYVYEENETVEYVFGDVKNKFFTVYPSFFQDDIGVTIANNYKEKKNKDILDGAAQQLFNNAQTPDMILSMIEILEADTAAESKKILQRGLKALETIRQENNKAQVEQEKIKQQAEDGRKKQELDNKTLGYLKDIKVAEIQVNGKISQTNATLHNQNVTKLADIEKELIQSLNTN